MSKTTFAKTDEAPKVGPYQFSHYLVIPQLALFLRAF